MMTARSAARDGAFPFLGDSRGRGFLIHAVVCLLLFWWLNWQIVTQVPFAIKGIGSSYLIFFYHFPSAFTTYLFYGGGIAASVLLLCTHNSVWDRRAQAAIEVGVLGNAILLATGMTWAKAAWNVWWRWEDKRLISAAVMFLIYLGYLVLQRSVEDSRKRERFGAVYACLAFLNVPLVHYSIQWFGEVSHPKKFDELSSDVEITATRWFGVLVFFAFYLLLYRWSHDRETVRQRAEAVRWQVRELEEGNPR
jgi:heme exporter protein C